MRRLGAYAKRFVRKKYCDRIWIKSPPASPMTRCRRRRSGRLVELDLKYAGVIVRRQQEFTGQAAMLGRNDQTFEDIAAGRGASAAI